MRTLRKIFLALALLSQAGPLLAQAAKDATPAPATGPATTVVVPSQAPSPRDNTVPAGDVLENPYGI